MRHGRGRSRNDIVIGTPDKDKLNGGSGNDLLQGLAGNDKLSGGSGNDWIHGGDGDDKIAAGSGNDLIDGGADSDRVKGDSGNDTLVYVAVENAGSHDSYDGGSGIDTLRLVLTREEWLHADVQADIARFLCSTAGTLSPKGMAKGHSEFSFSAFDLTIRKIENLSVIVDGVEIDPRDQAVLAADDSATVNEDGSVSGNVLANDVVPDLVRDLTLASGPAKGSVELNADGTFVYTPNAAQQSLAQGQTVTDAFTYTVTDADGDTATATVTITITGTNDAPMAAVDVAAAMEDGPVIAGNVLANDTDVDQGAVLTVANAGTYAGTYGTLVLNADGTYSYLLNETAQGLAEGQQVQESFSYTTTDEFGATAESTLTITLTGTNDAPVATADVATVIEDEQPITTGNVLANDTDADQGTALAVANPGTYAGAYGTLVLNADGSYAYTLDTSAVNVQALAPGQQMTETFAYQASDGLTSTPSVLTITIIGTNDGPVANGDSYAADEDHVLNVPAADGVLANDTDADQGDTRTLAMTGPIVTALGASVVLNADGSFSYDPTGVATLQALGAGQSALDSFTYTIRDAAGAESTATASITIAGANDAPVAADDSFELDEDETISGNVLANDSDVDGALTASLVTGPQHGSLTFNTDGTFTYAPTSNWSGTDSFTYTASDGMGGTATATVTLNVAAVADAPTLEVRAGNSHEFRVNTTTAGDQSTADIAALPGGGFVVIWQSFGQDGSSNGLYAQRYDAAGNRVGSEFQVNTHTAGSQDSANVTALADGGFVVTWASDGQDGSRYGVYAQRYDAEGNPVGSEFRANTTTDYQQHLHSVASLSDGGFIIMWSGSNAAEDDYEAYAQRYDANGNPIGGEFRINTYTGSFQAFPTAATLANGDLILTWSSDGQDGSLYGVFGRRYDASGNAIGGEFQINTHTPNYQYAPQIAALADGGFVVTWSSSLQDGSNWGVFAQRYDASGAKVGGEFRANTTTSNLQFDPSITALPDGGFVITWESFSGTGYDVYAQRYDASGARIGGETRINSVTAGHQYGSEVAALEDGRVVVVWHASDQDGSGYGVFGKVVSGVVTTNEDTPAALDIQANLADIDGSESLAITISGVPEGATLSNGTNNGDGTWTLTPTQLSGLTVTPPADFTGSFNLTVTATATEASNGSSASASRIVTVHVNAAPDAQDDAFSGNEDSPITGNVLANDSDADTNPLSVVAGTYTTANGGTVVLQANGNFTYTPLANAHGADSFTYTVNDGFGGSDTATVNLTVNAVADTPIFTVGGPEFQVNTHTDNAQRWPQMTTLPDGGFVAVWMSYTQDGSGDGIYGQRFDADGNKVGGEFRVNSQLTGDQNFPTIASLADGGFVVAWDSEANTANAKILAQRFDADANPVGSEFRLDSGNHTGTYRPAIVGLADGGFVATWFAWWGDGNYYGIRAQRFDADGGKLGAEFVVNTSTADAQDWPTMASLDGGGFVVLWESQGTDGSGEGVYGQRFDANGAKIGGEFRVNSFTAGAQNEPAVAALRDGGFIVTWTSNNQVGANSFQDIYAQRYDADGNKVGGEFLVNTTTTSNQWQSSVVGLADGGFLVTWDNWSSNGATSPDIYGQRYDANGNKVGGEFTVNGAVNSGQAYSSLLTLPDGRVVAMYASGSEVVGRILAPNAAGDMDSAIRLDITAALTDTDGSETLSIRIAGVPSGATLSAGIDNGDGTWTLTSAQLAGLTITPPSGYVGTFDLTITAIATEGSNGNTTSATKTLPVVVRTPNHAPVAVADTASVTEDTAPSVSGNVLANDSDSDAGTTLTVAGAGTKAGTYGTLVLNADGSYTYTLNAAAQSLAQGQQASETFTYRVFDGEKSTESTLTIDIAGTNDAPKIMAATDADKGQAFENSTWVPTGKLDGSDADQGAILTWSAQATYGTLSLQPNGTWSYVLDNTNPTVDALQGGQQLIDNVLVTLTDEHGATATHTVSITIRGSGDAPRAEADKVIQIAETSGAVPLNIMLPTDPEGGNLGLQITAVPSSDVGVIVRANFPHQPLVEGSGLSLDELGNLLFIPNPNAGGKTATFSYVVRDSNGMSDSANVEISIIETGTTTLTFEDAPDGQPVPTGYGGFDWYAINPIAGGDLGAANAYGSISAPRVLFNRVGAETTAVARGDGGDFTFDGAYIGRHYGASSLTLIGFNDGVQVGSVTYDLGTTDNGAMQWVAPGFGPIDELRFQTTQWSTWKLDDFRFHIDPIQQLNLAGSTGNDILVGGDADDRLTGAAGDDRLTGGGGNDIFVYTDGHDTIPDFSVGDVIDLTGIGEVVGDATEVLARATQVGADTVIDFGGGDSITLLGVDRSLLETDDFLV